MTVRRAFAAVPLLMLTMVAAAKDERQWFTLAVDGKRTGYAFDETQTTQSGVIEREVVVLDVKQSHARSRIERRFEITRDNDGRPRAVRYETNTGTVRLTWTGTIGNGAMNMHWRVSGRAVDATIPFSEQTVLSTNRTQIFADLWQRKRDAMELPWFDPASQQTVAAQAQTVAATPEGRLEVRFTRPSGNAPSIETFWFDAGGDVARIETGFLGTKLQWTPCVHDCDARITEPMDVMEHLVVRSPVRIPAAAVGRKIRYVITRTDGQRPELAQTPEQSVVYDGNRAIVTVCTDCGPEETPTGDELRRYSQPNTWVRSDDRDVRNTALRNVLKTGSVESRMLRLTLTVERRMLGSNDFLGYADAVEALRTGSGDCTEFAVLLAAFARAEDIPARIVVGLAYSSRFSGKKDVFSPHMWVQAWTGQRWKSYDAALTRFDSTHIAFATGDGDPRDFNRQVAQLPLLRIEKAGVLREP